MWFISEIHLYKMLNEKYFVLYTEQNMHTMTGFKLNANVTIQVWKILKLVCYQLLTDQWHDVVNWEGLSASQHLEEQNKGTREKKTIFNTW